MAVLALQHTTGGLTPTYSAASPTGDSFANTGAQTLLVRNLSPVPITVTVVAQNPCNQGVLHPLPYVVAPGASMILPPLTTFFYSDGNGNTSITYSAVAQAPPALPAVASGAAGLPNGTYVCAVTFVSAAGETNAGAPAIVVVASQQIAWSAIPIGPAGTTSRKLYRGPLTSTDTSVVTESARINAGAVVNATTVAPAVAGALYLVTTLTDNSTTVYTDNVADTALGAAVPVANVVQVAVTAN